MNKFLFFAGIVAVFLGILLFYTRAIHATQQKLSTMRFGDQVLSVEVARTTAEQEKGLSDRTKLPENRGMLFVFPVSGSYSFWMKDMRFNLDIIWVSEDQKVLGISENLTPESYSRVFLPPSPARYVLEVNAGWAKRHNVLVGVSVELPFHL